MRKGIATQTNRFELFDATDAVKRLLGIVTAQLPAFEIATNEYSGSGVGGSINVPAPGVMNALTASISVPKIYGDAIQFFKLGGTRAFDLRVDTIAANNDTHGVEHIPEAWFLKGPVTKSDPGKIEQKATGDATFELQVWYAAHWLDGELILEWDALNAIHTVNGVDLLDSTRRNISLI